MKNIQHLHQWLYESGRGRVIGKFILLLTHTGRKSGKRYVTPLQYEVIDGVYCVGAGNGRQCDWFRNILANPQVHVRVDQEEFDCQAEAVSEPGRVADFLACRLKRHPLMIGLIMKFAHGLPLRPSRQQLVELAGSLPMVILRPTVETA